MSKFLPIEKPKKGCSYCIPNNINVTKSIDSDIWLSGRELHILNNGVINKVKINYCPICGRKL